MLTRTVDIDAVIVSKIATVKLGYQVDDGPWQFANVPTSDTLGAAVSVPLAVGLTLPVNIPYARTHHSIRCYVYASASSGAGIDRWQGGGSTGGSYLRIRSATIDAGARTVTPELHPKRMIVYGDSITEGVNAQLYDFTTGTCSRTGLNAAAAPMSWAQRFAEGLDAEVSNIAFAAQGYVATSNRKTLPTENLLEDTDRFRRPPF